VVCIIRVDKPLPKIKICLFGGRSASHPFIISSSSKIFARPNNKLPPAFVDMAAIAACITVKASYQYTGPNYLRREDRLLFDPIFFDNIIISLYRHVLRKQLKRISYEKETIITNVFFY
jgi:hypothetical protein